MKDIANHLNISINAVEYFMRHNNLERIGYSEANNILFSHKKPSFRIKKKFTTDEKQLQLIGTTLY
jgi:hypothetical protein